MPGPDPGIGRVGELGEGTSFGSGQGLHDGNGGDMMWADVKTMNCDEEAR